MYRERGEERGEERSGEIERGEDERANVLFVAGPAG
jgi:hypothetical protein